MHYIHSTIRSVVPCILYSKVIDEKDYVSSEKVQTVIIWIRRVLCTMATLIYSIMICLLSSFVSSNLHNTFPLHANPDPLDVEVPSWRSTNYNGAICQDGHIDYM